MLVTADYSDTTPDITLTFDNFGRPVTQSNGLATSTFAYDPATLQIDTETIAYDFDLDGTADFTRVLDREQDNLLRDTGWQLKDATTIENEAAHTYSNIDGRISEISNPQISSSFDYTYTTNSNLIESVTSPSHTVTNTWETDRNVLSLKENKVGSTNISSYDYTVNAIGQRTDVSQTGTAFGSSRDITWGYDSKGQVTKADSTIPGLDRAYQFDMIGNRLRAATGSIDVNDPTATVYTPNALNQYTAIDGLTPSYDDDGNMTSGPLPANPGSNSSLTWDGENRLISATVNGVTTTYRYDAQSRRIAIWSAGLQPASSPPTTTFVYDGWNPIAEHNSSYALTKSYTWGLDLSGTMQGAGGVGGLLAVAIHDQQSSIFYPLFDGNGNVSEYLDTNGNVVAHYEYDPFGKTTVATGSNAQDFAHRFSTKPLDVSTGLYYYGYRYYDPATGRWPSRDPIEESGGVNLYAFVGNDGVNRWDIHGLTEGTTRNCVTTSFNFGYALTSIPPVRAGLLTVRLRGRIDYSISITTCDMCCDGSWETGVKTRTTGTGSGNLTLTATLGVDFDQQYSGFKVRAWGGVRATGSGNVTVSISGGQDCDGNSEATLTGSVGIGGGIAGGVSAEFHVGRWRLGKTSATVGGEFNGSIGVSASSCSDGGCTGWSFTPGSVSGNYYAEACAYGFCFRKDF